MLVSFALLLILCGIGIMGFGLLMFYAWLPLLYGLFGLEIGLLLGRGLTGDVGAVAITLGIAAALAAASAAYFLEPYRRALVGFMGGVVLVLTVLSVLGLDRLISGLSVSVLSAIGGVLGATVALRYFDLFIVVASAFGGAALIVTGAQLLLPTPTEPSGTVLPALVTTILGIFGLRWQLRTSPRGFRRSQERPTPSLIVSASKPACEIPNECSAKRHSPDRRSHFIGCRPIPPAVRHVRPGTLLLCRPRIRLTQAAQRRTARPSSSTLLCRAEARTAHSPGVCWIACSRSPGCRSTPSPALRQGP